MTRVDVVNRIDIGDLTMREGALMLGMSVRHLRRLRRRFEEDGEAGLVDRRAGRQTGRRLKSSTAHQIVHLYRHRYSRLTMRHFHEKLLEVEGVAVSYSTTRRVLQRAGLVVRAKRRGVYRRRRPRQSRTGFRVHMDGSTHEWLGPERPKADLVIVLDDADSRLLSAQFVEEEGTLSSLWALLAVFRRYGRFCELYMDRGSHHYPYNEDWEHQLTRVLKALCIRPIYGKGPQGRGRCERKFGTLQSRLINELALAGITDYEAANEFLQTTYIDDHNRRFTVEPQEATTAFTAIPETIDLQLLLSIHEQRVVRNDMTVHYQRRVLQLPARTRVRPKTYVTVHTFVDRSLGISFQGNLVATFKPDGTPRHPVGVSAPPGGYLPTTEYTKSYGSELPYSGGHL